MTRNDAHKPRVALKLFAFILSFVGAIILLLWLLQVAFLGAIHQSVVISQTKDIAKKLETYTSSPLTLESNAQKLASDKSVCILAYRFEGNVATMMFSCDVSENCVIHSITKGELISFHHRAKENGGRLLQQYVYNAETSTYEQATKNKDGQWIVYSFVVKDTRGDDMLFLINAYVAPVASTVRTLNYMLIIIGLATVVLSAILTLILARSITKPITEISASALELAKGNYCVTFNGGSYREAEELYWSQ